MQTVRISGEKLKEILEGNLIKHRAEYAEAQALYLRDFKQQLEDKLASINGGKTPEQRFDQMPVPQSYEEDYTRVLQMIDLSEDDILTLTQQEFAQYVQDEWGWKHAFAATTSNYSSKFG